MENKIWVIKAIREISNCGLKEAIDLANTFDEGKATPEQAAIVAVVMSADKVIPKSAIKGVGQSLPYPKVPVILIAFLNPIAMLL